MATRLIVVVLLGALLNACATQPRVRLDTGRGASREYSPSSSGEAVRVDEEAFEKLLAQLVLSTPVTLRQLQEGWLVRASSPGRREDPRWRRLMRKTLRDDVMGLSEWDKLGVGLGLSLHPLKESISKAVEDTLAPQLFLTIIAAGLITWAVLAANPEPVFTKPRTSSRWRRRCTSA